MDVRLNTVCYYLAFLSFVIVTIGCACEGSVTLNIEQGIITGKIEKTLIKQKSYFSYKGIPYAEPPIGDLRFQAPKPYVSWGNTYFEALQNKPTCLQGSARSRNGEPYGISGSEDCLYLNVFTPLKPSISYENSLAVIVFDYTDNFRTGFNGTDTYSPDFFMEEDIIVVTISHRLSLFGYLTTEDVLAPPNNGLKDFMLGLQWIQDNILKFGGDPQRVTIMGSKGGGALANMLLYCSKAKGLFSAVALQGGTALEAIYFPDNPRKAAFDLGEAFDVITDDSAVLLEALRNIDASELIVKEYKAVDHDKIITYQQSIYPFSPVLEPDYEGSVLTVSPDSKEVVNDVPVIIGFNSRDGLDLVSHYIFEPRLLVDTNKEFLFNFPVRAGIRFDVNSSSYKEAIKEINDFYFEDGGLTIYNILDYAVYVGDILQTYAADYAAKHLSSILNSPVYYYMFDFKGSLNENTLYMNKHNRFPLKNWGATITDDLCYLHVCSRIRKNYVQLKEMVSEQPELKVLKKMVRMWANFAKTGNPTPADDPDLKGLTWEPVNRASQKYLHIAKRLYMNTDPIEERAKFWDGFLKKYMGQAVDGVVKDVDGPRDEL